MEQIRQTTTPASAAKPKRYGVKHAADTLGVDVHELLTRAVIDDCPSVCRKCGAVNESGHEPDAVGYDCEECGEAGTVNSVLVLAGMI